MAEILARVAWRAKQGFGGRHVWIALRTLFDHMTHKRLGLVMPITLAVRAEDWAAHNGRPPHRPEDHNKSQEVLAYCGILDLDCPGKRPPMEIFHRLWARHVAGDVVTVGDLYAAYPPLQTLHDAVHAFRCEMQSRYAERSVFVFMSGSRGFHVFVCDAELWTRRLLADRADATHARDVFVARYADVLERTPLTLDESASKNDHGLKPEQTPHATTYCQPRMCGPHCRAGAPCERANLPLFVAEKSKEAQVLANQATAVWRKIYSLLPVDGVPVLASEHYVPEARAVPTAVHSDHMRYAFLSAYANALAARPGPRAATRDSTNDCRVYSTHCVACGATPVRIDDIPAFVAALCSSKQQYRGYATGVNFATRAGPTRLFVDVDACDLREPVPGLAEPKLVYIVGAIARVVLTASTTPPAERPEHVVAYVDMRRSASAGPVLSWHVCFPQVVLPHRLHAEQLLQSIVPDILATAQIELDMEAVKRGTLSTAYSVKGADDGSVSRQREMFAVLRVRVSDHAVLGYPGDANNTRNDACVPRNAFRAMCILPDCALPDDLASADARLLDIPPQPGVDDSMLTRAPKRAGPEGERRAQRMRTGVYGVATVDDAFARAVLLFVRLGMLSIGVQHAQPTMIGKGGTTTTMYSARLVPNTTTCPYNVSGGHANAHSSSHMMLQVDTALCCARVACDDDRCGKYRAPPRLRAWYPI